MAALLGVALGAVLTFVVQWLLSRRNEKLRLRTELLEACAAFAGAAENARGAQYDRWWSKFEGRPPEGRASAKSNSYQRRTELRVAQSRLRLLGLTGSAATSAADVVTRIGNLHREATRDGLEASGREILNQINVFLDEAGRATR